MIDKDVEQWLDRVKTLMDVQKDLQLELINMTCTRADLVTLSVLLGSINDLRENDLQECLDAIEYCDSANDCREMLSELLEDCDNG